MTEAALVTKIRKTLDKSRPGFWIKIHGGLFQATGLPDIIGCYKGRFYGLEVKLPGKEDTLTERQQYIINRINQAEGRATMLTSVQEALEFTKE